MGMSYDTLQRELMTYMLKLLYGESYPEPTLANLKAAKFDGEYKRMEKFLKKQVGKKSLDMSMLLQAANMTIEQLTIMSGMLSVAQKDMYKSKILAILQYTEPERSEAISRMTTELLTQGMKGVSVGNRVWNIDNWLRININNIKSKMYQDMSFKAGEDAGTTVYRVSQHGGAREKCFPWQNKLVDFVGPTRTEVVNGITYRITNINETSYGEPDGLRGVNCRHILMPFILGFNKLGDDIVDATENEKTVKGESQKRTLESRIRNLRTQKMYRRGVGEDITRYNTRINKATAELYAVCDQYNLKVNPALLRAYK